MLSTERIFIMQIMEIFWISQIAFNHITFITFFKNIWKNIYNRSPLFFKLYYHIKHIPPSARENCGFILVSNLNNNNIQILADEYTLGNCNRKNFINIYQQSIVNYRFLLINNSSTKNNDINEIYGIMRVPKSCLKIKNY